MGRVNYVGYEEGQPFADIRVQPFAALDRVRYLLLLWPQPKLSDTDAESAELETKLGSESSNGANSAAQRLGATAVQEQGAE